MLVEGWSNGVLECWSDGNREIEINFFSLSITPLLQHSKFFIERIDHGL
jgi:hypothetical protein